MKKTISIFFALLVYFSTLGAGTRFYNYYSEGQRYMEDKDCLYVGVGSLEYYLDKRVSGEERVCISRAVAEARQLDGPDSVYVPGTRIVDTDHDTLSVCFASELGHVQADESKRRKKG